MCEQRLGRSSEIKAGRMVPVGGAFTLQRSAARGADDGDAVTCQTCSKSIQHAVERLLKFCDAYRTMSRAILLATLPMLVPPNFCTIHPPGRSFSLLWCGIERGA